MSNNRFRYPPAPPNGAGTFSDNLVGNQWTDGTSQMSNGNFTITENYESPQQTNFGNDIHTYQFKTRDLPLKILHIDYEN